MTPKRPAYDADKALAIGLVEFLLAFVLACLVLVLMDGGW